MEIVFLGTGGSFPSPQRGVSSIAIKTHGEILLFDCGEGTQRQLMRSPLSFMQITKIFITHFHGDHWLGLPGLLQTMSLNGRTLDLEVYGPKGTEQLITIVERISYYSRTFDLVLHELKDKQVEHFDGFQVTAHRLDHSIPTLGYLLKEDDRPGKFDLKAANLLGIPEGPLYARLQAGEEVIWEGRVIKPEMVIGPRRPGRRVFIAMDTKPILNLPDLIQGADVLIHEATSDHSLEDKANKFGHSTAAQAATIAKEANVRKLYLVHISPRYRDSSMLLDEAKAIFEETFLPSDLESFEVLFPDQPEKTAVDTIVEEEAEEPEEEGAPLGLDEPHPEVPGADAKEDMGALVAELEDVVNGTPGDMEGVVADGDSPNPESPVPVSILESPAPDLTGKPAGEEDEDFDLDRAMREAGLDPSTEDEEL